jgi:hypothetical protein
MGGGGEKKRHGEKKFASTKTAMMHRGRGAVQLKRTLKRTLLFVLHSIDTICCDMMIERITVVLVVAMTDRFKEYG